MNRKILLFLFSFFVWFNFTFSQDNSGASTGVTIIPQDKVVTRIKENSFNLMRNSLACEHWTPLEFSRAIIDYCGYVSKIDAPTSSDDYLILELPNNEGIYFDGNRLNKVMTKLALYKYDSFWASIKKFPCYVKCICSLHEAVKRNDAVANCLSDKAKKRVAQQANSKGAAPLDLVFTKQVQEKMAIEGRQASIKTSFVDQLPCKEELVQRYEEQCKVHSYYEYGNLQRITERFEVACSVINNGVYYIEKHYKVHSDIVTRLQKHGMSNDVYGQCYGNQLQQSIHQDCIDIAQEIVLVKPHSVIYPYKEGLLQCTQAAFEYNSNGYTQKASYITDFCWMFLDCGKACMEGVFSGVTGAMKDIIEHPVHTAACVVAGKYVFTYQLSKVLYNVASIGVTYLRDPERGQRKWEEYLAPINHVIDTIKDKSLTLRDVIKGGSQVAAHLYTQQKLLTGLNKICTTSRDKISEFIKNNPAAQPKQYVVTPEGVVYKASDAPENTSKGRYGSWQKINKKTDVVKFHNMKQFFNESEFGRLLKKHSVKAEGRYDGQSIYKITQKIQRRDYIIDKDDYFYLDGLHKDHLEFFSKSRKSKMVLDLNGALNIKKTELIKNGSRNIK